MAAIQDRRGIPAGGGKFEPEQSPTSARLMWWIFPPGDNDGGSMRQTHEWPCLWWSKVPPQVEDHPQGCELAWMARGHPFNRPVIARSNVGVKCISPQGIGGGKIIKPTYGPFVRVELMADGFHGQDASTFGWFRKLEWIGPLVLPQ